MKYVVCTQKAPLALYDQSTLRDLGPMNVEHLKLLERTDTMHFLSYVAPCMGRGDDMSPETLHNLLLVSGFQQQHDEKSVMVLAMDSAAMPAITGGGGGDASSCCHRETQHAIKGILPSKTYPSLPVEISIILTVTDSDAGTKKEEVPSSQCGHVVCRVDSLRFQITDAHRCI